MSVLIHKSKSRVTNIQIVLLKKDHSGGKFKAIQVLILRTLPSQKMIVLFCVTVSKEYIINLLHVEIICGVEELCHQTKKNLFDVILRVNFFSVFQLLEEKFLQCHCTVC